jgi:hemoglobin
MGAQPTDFERLGGEAGVRPLVEAVCQAFFDDFIIGFRFEGKDHARIIAKEYEHARHHLGGPGGYSGRPVAQVHRPLKINQGQFRRRLAILQTVLTEAGVASDVVERWVGHDAALEAAITDGTDCVPKAPQ